MGLTLTSYPVTVESGTVLNLFPGFKPIPIEFERVDVALISLGQGIDNKIEIVVSGNVVIELNEGEWIYLFATGTTYDYNDSFQVISLVYGVGVTTILLDSDFIELSNSGYVNYKQNYFVEMALVRYNNENILQYKGLLTDSGTPSGSITIDASPLVDGLRNEVLSTSGEVETSRERCKIKYREVWREQQSNSYVFASSEYQLIICYAADDFETEKFITEFDEPRMYAGYPFIMTFSKSLDNNLGKDITVNFNELDINKDDITINNELKNYPQNIFGFCQANFNDNIVAIDDYTRYIEFELTTNDLFDYDSNDYDSNDYVTD